tara:strand:- start:557 stop:1012 length:456 start_codon:yes stop_codon:yes gene_type:complete
MHIVTNNEKIDISSEKLLEELAVKVFKNIKLGDIIFLIGEMGVGKTTFVKYLVNEFQKQNKLKLTEVTSPTFNLLNEYDINNIKINHYDLYRIKSSKEIENLGIFENIYDAITLIEWPQMIENKPKDIIEFEFNYEKNYQKRSICIQGLSI